MNNFKKDRNTKNVMREKLKIIVIRGKSNQNLYD